MNENNSIPEPLTVDNLRKEGFQVRVNHYRFTAEEFQRRRGKPQLYKRKTAQVQFAPHARGGKTTVEVVKQGHPTRRGESVCFKTDNFNRKEGVRIALETAFGVHKKTNPFILFVRRIMRRFAK